MSSPTIGPHPIQQAQQQHINEHDDLLLWLAASRLNQMLFANNTLHDRALADAQDVALVNSEEVQTLRLEVLRLETEYAMITPRTGFDNGHPDILLQVDAIIQCKKKNQNQPKQESRQYVTSYVIVADAKTRLCDSRTIARDENGMCTPSKICRQLNKYCALLRMPDFGLEYARLRMVKAVLTYDRNDRYDRYFDASDIYIFREDKKEDVMN